MNRFTTYNARMLRQAFKIASGKAAKGGSLEIHYLKEVNEIQAEAFRRKIYL